MKAVNLFLVLFNVGLAAPLPARPRVPVAAWPGVSDVLLNVAVVASVAAAPVAAWPNNSQQPGSVLVFPKFIRGPFPNTPVTGQLARSRTNLEFIVRCPRGESAGSN